MATATAGFYLNPPGLGYGSAGAADPPNAGLLPEGAPSILWSQGTPAAIPPFTLVNKGSICMVVNATDDTTALYMKVDEALATTDWVRIFAENEALIDTNDLSATAGIVDGQIANATITGGKLVNATVTVEKLETNALSNCTRSILVDISATDSETIPLYAPAALTITRIDLIWQEATTASGAAEGDVTIGTATGGAQIVTAANGAYAVSQATGANQNLTITSGAVAADGSVFQSHDIADAAAGTYFCQYLWDFDS